MSHNYKHIPITQPESNIKLNTIYANKINTTILITQAVFCQHHLLLKGVKIEGNDGLIPSLHHSQ